MFRFCWNHLQGASGISENQRYRCTVNHNWQHTYTVVFLKYRMLPENGLSKTETCWSLQCINMIFNFFNSVTFNIYCGQCKGWNKINKYSKCTDLKQIQKKICNRKTYLHSLIKYLDQPTELKKQLLNLRNNENFLKIRNHAQWQCTQIRQQWTCLQDNKTG